MEDSLKVEFGCILPVLTYASTVVDLRTVCYHVDCSAVYENVAF